MSSHNIVRAFILCLTLLLGTGWADAQEAPAILQFHRNFAQRIVEASERGEMGGKPLADFMRQEKVALLEGDFALLKTLIADPTTSMDVALVDGRRYAVRYQKDSIQRVTLSYPADYQLIMGVSLMEMENSLSEAINEYARLKDKESKSQNDKKTIRHRGDGLENVGGLYVMKGNSYILPELNNDRFYVAVDDSTYDLLYSEDLPVETMANLVTGCEIETQIDITFTLVKYGYRTETFTVPLQQWVSYCVAEGCTPFFGVIEKKDTQVVCEVVMHNELLGYAHVTKLMFDPQILADRKGTIKARINSYVPLSNVKNIFSEY